MTVGLSKLRLLVEVFRFTPTGGYTKAIMVIGELLLKTNIVISKLAHIVLVHANDLRLF